MNRIFAMIVLLLLLAVVSPRPQASSITGASGGAALMGGNFVLANVGASSTNYLCWGVTSASATENQRNWYVGQAGTIRNFYITTNNAQPASGSLVLTLRKNGVDQAVTITIAASAAAGNFSDTSNSFSVAAGDLLTIKAQNNATAGSAQLIAWGIGFTQ